MVPASASESQGPRPLAARGILLAVPGLLPGLLAGLFAHLLIAPAVRAADGIEWQRAFLVGSIGRSPAVSEPIDAFGPDQVELFLVLEGEENGVPQYCTQAPSLRVNGRQIAARLMHQPAECGLEQAEIRWVTLALDADLSGWQQTRAVPAEDGWSLPTLVLPGEAPGLHSSVGTVRWAAAISLLDGRLLGSDGWEKRANWAHPEHAPGYRVSRARNASFDGQLARLARLPVTPQATVAHERARIAFTPCGLVFGAYEGLAKMQLEGDTSAELAGSEWSWLFEMRQQDVVRRKSENAACVGPRGQPIAWVARSDPNGPGLQRGDILVLDGECIILRIDDGDGWLGNGDGVLHSSPGVLASGVLGDVTGRRGFVLRPRSFQDLRMDLARAGYGNLGVSWIFGPEVKRTLREFQRDQDLPVTGIPDEATVEALASFLAELRAAGSGE